MCGNHESFIPHRKAKGLSTPVPDVLSLLSISDKNRRDMIWSLFGPSLLRRELSTPLENLLPQCQPELLMTDTPVTMDFQSPRLGFCFEQLWHTGFQACGVEHVSNLQIQTDDNGTVRTLGELDLLLPQKDQILHIELALKFYLGVKDDWIGPNRRDLLSRKLTHTFGHQLPLVQSPEAAKAINATGLATDNRPVNSVAIMRGCLFHPIHDIGCADLPAEISPDHWRGYWCPANQLELLPDADWYVLSKPDWISPVVSTFAVSTNDLRQYLNCYFRYLRTPVCVALMAHSSTSNSENSSEKNSQSKCYETERWMIVPSDWEAPAPL